MKDGNKMGKETNELLFFIFIAKRIVEKIDCQFAT